MHAKKRPATALRKDDLPMVEGIGPKEELVVRINSYSPTSFEHTLLSAIAERQLMGRLREACEQWVATQDRFNSWFLRVPKRHYSEERLLGVIDIAEDTHEAVEAAWNAYQTTPDSETEEVLVRSLSRSREACASLMQEPTSP